MSVATYKLVVSNASMSGNGHHTIQCHIQEDGGGSSGGNSGSDGDDVVVIHGVSETHGIDSIALQTRFGGDIHKWRNWVASAMLERHRSRRAVNEEILQWRDKKFDIPDIPDIPDNADASADVPADASADVPADASADVPADASADVPADASADVPADASADASADVPADASADATPAIS